MAKMQHQQRFRLLLECLTREIDTLRNEQAAIGAYREARPTSNRFLRLAFMALLGDRLIRLIRIFDDEQDGASFWYLYRCAPQRMKNLDLERLRAFSRKLKTVRDLVFVHSDNNGCFDPVAIWDAAEITDGDMAHAVETVRRALYDLSAEEFSKARVSFTDNDAPSLLQTWLRESQTAGQEEHHKIVSHESLTLMRAPRVVQMRLPATS
jgi:hypothetical protein